MIVRTQARSTSMRSPRKPKGVLSKVAALQWSFTSKDHIKTLINTQPGELVKTLETGPRSTKDPITKLVTSQPQRILQGKGHKEVDDSSNNGRPVVKAHPSQNISAEQKRNNSLCNGNKVKAKDCDSLMQRPSKRTNNHQSRTPNFQYQLQTVLSSHCSHTAPSPRDSTMRNTTSGGSYLAQKDMLQFFLHSDDRKGHRDSNHDTILPFFKRFFIKKNISGSTEEQYILKNSQAQLGKMTIVNHAILSLSNGRVPSVVLEDKKVSVITMQPQLYGW